MEILQALLGCKGKFLRNCEDSHGEKLKNNTLFECLFLFLFLKNILDKMNKAMGHRCRQFDTYCNIILHLIVSVNIY